jgi:hypothetical protein
MLRGANDINELFANKNKSMYTGLYNKLLSELFIETSFMVSFELQSIAYMFVLFAVDGILPTIPIFFFYILPESAWNDAAACKSASDKLKKLMIEAVAPIKVIHGICVSGTRFAHYRYDHAQEVMTPGSEQQLHFDFDLKDESGADRLLSVVEDVKNMCREVVGELKVELPEDDVDSEEE